MPELPEVETTRLGITPYILGKTLSELVVRNPKLRWPVDSELPQRLARQTVHKIERRGKYLLLFMDSGCALLHLGMSGSLRITELDDRELRPHDHIDWQFTDGTVLRFNDPRRFGALLWTEAEPKQHELLRQLGPEPLDDVFDGDYLYNTIHKRQALIKTVIMDSHIVVGVGNIYASEALFSAAIRPDRAAGSLNLDDCLRLSASIKHVLAQAIQQGGTTLRDFRNPQGKPGYFQQQLHVYGRADQDCHRCGGIIEQKTIGQRASYFCGTCQF